jgi:nucleoside-diphosphate-sugar epimerase
MFLLTGRSGFLGKAITAHFTEKNIKFKSLGRAREDDYQLDLTFEQQGLLKDEFECVIHCAGKAHSIPKTTIEKQEFYNVNVKGTDNLLKLLESLPALPTAFIFISTVAVYGLRNGHFIDEDYPLLANDPYGLSKIQAEEMIKYWCKNNDVQCTILRLPLIAGSDPPGNLGAMIKAIKKGYYFNVGGGIAKKSVVLAEDVARMLPTAAMTGGIYNLTDRRHPNFRELSEVISNQLQCSSPLSIPIWLAKLLALTGDLVGNKAPLNSEKLFKITTELTFNDDKAVSNLNWNPNSVLKEFKI